MQYDVEFSRLRCALASVIRDGGRRITIDHARAPSEAEAGRRGENTKNPTTKVHRSLGRSDKRSTQTTSKIIRHLGSRSGAIQSKFRHRLTCVGVPYKTVPSHQQSSRNPRLSQPIPYRGWRNRRRRLHTARPPLQKGADQQRKQVRWTSTTQIIRQDRPDDFVASKNYRHGHSGRSRKSTVCSS